MTDIETGASSDALDLSLRASALVLIDLQVGVTNIGMDHVPHTAEVVLANASRLADAFRRAQRPVIYVRVNYGADNALQVTVPNDWQMGFAPPAGWDELDPRAGAADSDIVVTKHVYNAFHGTDLDLTLRRLAVDTLVVGGISTHQGVEATVRAAHDHGYRQVFVEDAMAAFSEVHHSYPIEQVFPLFGSVRTTDVVLTDLADR